MLTVNSRHGVDPARAETKLVLHAALNAITIGQVLTVCLGLWWNAFYLSISTS